jgi:hypothetical protein
MAQLNTTNYPLSPLKHVTGLDASGNVRHGTAPPINVKDHGAKGDGTTDDTTALKAAFDAAMASGRTLVLDEGTYLVSGPISTISQLASVNLHLQCKGLVQINVSGSATAFDTLLMCYSTAAHSVSITGGILSIDCNNKCGDGIYIRTSAATSTGVVNISTPVTILNCKQNNSSQVNENQGILVYGEYAKIIMQQPTVVGVTRTNTTGGGCKGIAIANFSGEVIINQPHVENILLPVVTAADADGIATFAKQSGGVETLLTPGKVTINQPVFIDCQGRSFKSQCSDTTIIRPRVYRKNAVAIAQCTEFDFQRGGNNLLVEPDFEFRLNSGVSPLGASHSCVAFQNLMTNAPMSSRAVGGFMRTEAGLPNYCLLIRGTGAAFSETVVEGLRVIPIGSFATTAITRALVEFNGADVVAATGKTVVRVSDCSGPLLCRGIGYTSYTSGDLSAKLDVEATDLRNTLGAASAAQPFSNLSGGFITQVDTFMFRNNTGYRDFTGGFTFNFNKLRPGCVFTVDIGNITATGAPAWGTSGYATIECLTDYFASTDKTVRVTKGSGAGIWFTQDGGATWGTTA